MTTHVFGIRHHGPGCARSLLAALERLQPDVVLIEGPPDAEDVLPLLDEADLQPPVALLIYPSDEPQAAVFYPFAQFSPEWQALQYARRAGIPARFMDLPARHRAALEAAERNRLREQLEAAAANPEAEGPATTPADSLPATQSTSPDGDSDDPGPLTRPSIEDDPLGALAVAAGYRDAELWWEQQVEQRHDATGLFQGILEAMTALRSTHESELATRPAKQSAWVISDRPCEALREAFMRQTIRQAVKDKFERIAVICGAWHAPVLTDLGPAKPDAELLAGLPKTKVLATWIPWTYSRLALQSGYGAGIRSPGWYDLLWQAPRAAPVRWVTSAARLLREADLDASSANVIETVRLAETLAAFRHLPQPGLAELNEATLAVLCAGNTSPLELIRTQLEIGDRLGTVPAATPAVPLQKDLEGEQKRLRLKPTTESKTLDLDLRNDTDRARSRLLHRLRLLGIEWGQTLEVAGKSGTFHEYWQLQWQVEFPVKVIEAALWGNTVESAADSYIAQQASTVDQLPRLTDLLDQTMLSGLPRGTAAILQRLQTLAAVSADVRHLMNSLPPLARVARYSDVRATDTEQILPVLVGFLERILVGLVPACASLDDDAATQMVQSIEAVQHSLDLLNLAEQRAEWRDVLRLLADQSTIHGLVRGYVCRLLLEQQLLSDDELQRRARLELSPAALPAQATAWLEGLLRGSGLVLLHRDGLWAALDRWIADLTSESFTELLPLVRRAFANFQPPERRAMGEKVQKLPLGTAPGSPQRTSTSSQNINHDRARLVLPVLGKILGISLSAK